MTQFLLLMDPNMNVEEEAAATLNEKCIQHVIDNLQEYFMPKESQTTSKKRMVGMNAPGNTQDIIVECDGQNASGRLVRDQD